MSNGSRRPWERPPRVITARPDAARVALTVCFVLVCSGCNHAGLHHASGVSEELRLISAEDLFREGVAYALRGDTLRAEQYLNASKQRGYDAEIAVAWLVRVCVASSRYQTALTHATTYLQENPSHWWLRFVVANIHDALGDVERARDELELVVEAEPDRPLPHYRLGVLYRERLQNRHLSRLHFEEYLRLEPQGSHSAEVRAVLADQSAADGGPQLVPYPEHLSPPQEAVQ
jgi:tetratricopeptide (TPR) repeat protein